ncbi:hypothetical protein CMUST_09250 [Corynebacterium mustelae]|uniref:Lipoprotein n=1 Tax=Corynebacterium mustelae TaxID=571915 RepID=A0A0G3GYG4_9CORY|nr:hypothetical protein [Corynebacterium mustelae]AKK06166.1 hypothetical protein CMUST_09250 [Corynebacterium mustelae]
MRKQLLVFASIILTATSVSGCGLVPWLFHNPNSDIVTDDPDFVHDELTEEKPVEFRSIPGEAGGFDCYESHCAVNFNIIDLKFADSCEDLGIPSDSEEYSSTYNGNQLLIVEASLELDYDLSFEAENFSWDTEWAIKTTDGFTEILEPALDCVLDSRFDSDWGLDGRPGHKIKTTNMYTLPPNDGNIYLLHDTQKATWQWPLPAEKTIGLAPPPNTGYGNGPDFHVVTRHH